MSTVKKIWIESDDCLVRTQDWHVIILIKLAIQAGFISCYDGANLVEDYNNERTDKDTLFNYLYNQREELGCYFTGITQRAYDASMRFDELLPSSYIR